MKLVNIAVHPEHSGKGVGRILIELCQTEARRQGYKEIRFVPMLPFLKISICINILDGKKLHVTATLFQ